LFLSFTAPVSHIVILPLLCPGAFIGAKVLVGGHREGAIMDATLVENVPHDVDLSCSEVFGPVLLLEKYASFREAVDRHVTPYKRVYL
jgi:hypothetical protein